MKLSDAELLNIIDGQEKNALGYGSGQLNRERETALKSYFQEPYGNEVEGRSQYITSEVADTVEWIKPSLMKIFASTDRVVEFEPQTPADDESAKQVTDVLNFLFMKRNNGFFVLQDWFSDALLTKNGYVKVYWDETTKIRKERYQGLTLDQLSMLLTDPKVKLIEQNEVQTEFGPAYDIGIEVERDGSMVRVEVIPPEEMLVSRNQRTVNLDDTEFVSHRRKMTLSELREMGHKVDDIGTDDDVDYFPEAQARDRYEDEERSGDHIDESLRRVWVSEAYLKVDYDGDGKAELRRVLVAGNKILENEEADIVPFACITPIVLSHRHYGRSVAELVEDLQFLKTTLWRQVLDNIYLTNNPRNAVLSGQDGSVQANLDDLLNVRVGGIVREYAPNAVRPLTVPFMAKEGLGVLEYVDTIRENRTGVTRYNQGLDANSLNKTASGITQIMTAAQQRIELIARIFAEGMKDMFKLMLHCQTKYGMRTESIKLRDKWIEYNPREWANEYDMSVSVGLGTGNKDQQLVHLSTIAQAQQVAVQMGGMDKLVTLKNIYNTQAKIAENAGFKDVAQFWTDPEEMEGQEQPPEGPSPEQMKAEADAQALQMKLQADQAATQMKMQAEAQKFQAETQIKQEEAAASMQLEREKAAIQMQLERERMEWEKEKFALEQQMELSRMAYENQRFDMTRQDTAEQAARVEQPKASEPAAPVTMVFGGGEKEGGNEAMAVAMAAVTSAVAQMQTTLGAFARSMTADRVPERDADGRVTRVRTELN